jgi:hypothetical protein
MMENKADFMSERLLNFAAAVVKKVRVTTWNSEIYDVNYRVRNWAPFHTVDNPRPWWHSFIYGIGN